MSTFLRCLLISVSLFLCQLHSQTQIVKHHAAANPPVVTALTTKSQGTTSTTLTQSLTLPSSTRLIATCVIAQTGATAKWNTLTMAIDTSVVVTSATTLYVYSLWVTSGATANFVATWTTNHSASCAFSYATFTNAGVDVVKNGTAASAANVSSGATVTTAQAVELAWGGVGCQYTTGTPAINGTWQNSFTPGQQTSGTNVIPVYEAYNVTASTGTYTAADNGVTTLNQTACVAAIVMYKTP